MSNKQIKLNELREMDKKILKHLILDSSQSYSSIAENIDTTRQNVSQRIKKLRKKSIIKSFTIDLNNEMIDELKVKAYILLREDPNTKIREEDEKSIIDIPQVTIFSRMFGKYDGIVEVIVKDNNELNSIVNKIHSFKGIKETETFIIRNSIKNDRKSPILNLLDV
jgi:Lrp/AsnC family transcriptional regulator for asnA, asnC and gidA